MSTNNSQRTDKLNTFGDVCIIRSCRELDRPKHVSNLCVHNKLITSEGINTFYIPRPNIIRNVNDFSFEVHVHSI